MSFDRPSGHGDGDRGDGRPDRPRERPFPGAPENRPYVPPPTGGGRSWEDVRAEKRKHTSQREYEASVQARREAVTKDDTEKKLASDGFPSKDDGKPDAQPGETRALRKRVADLEADKARQDQKIGSQSIEIARLKADNSAQAAEISGLRTELGDRKGADIERDWKDRARDDKIADLESTIGQLLRRERGDRQSDTGDDQPSTSIAERKKVDPPRSHERRFHLPSNTKMSLFSSMIGEGAAVDHVPAHASDYVGIGVATVSLGVSAVAAWREHRKNGRDDTDNRP